MPASAGFQEAPPSAAARPVRDAVPGALSLRGAGGTASPKSQWVHGPTADISRSRPGGRRSAARQPLPPRPPSRACLRDWHGVISSGSPRATATEQRQAARPTAPPPPAACPGRAPRGISRHCAEQITDAGRSPQGLAQLGSFGPRRSWSVGDGVRLRSRCALSHCEVQGAPPAEIPRCCAADISWSRPGDRRWPTAADVRAAASRPAPPSWSASMALCFWHWLWLWTLGSGRPLSSRALSAWVLRPPPGRPARPGTSRSRRAGAPRRKPRFSLSRCVILSLACVHAHHLSWSDSLLPALVSRPATSSAA